MKLEKVVQIDNLETNESSIKKSRKFLKEYKKKLKPDLSYWRVRVGKTIFLCRSFEKAKRIINLCDEYDLAKPGESLPPQKIKL